MNHLTAIRRYCIFGVTLVRVGGGQVPAEGAREGSLGANADAFQDNPTICFLECRTAAEALAGSPPPDPRLLQVCRPRCPISPGICSHWTS